jgi:hypothetical protein
LERRFVTQHQNIAVVAQLSVGKGEFWLADESPPHFNFSPESLGGGSWKIPMPLSNGLPPQEPKSFRLLATSMVGEWDESSDR